MLNRRTVLSGAACLAISALAPANTAHAAPAKPAANKDPVSTSVALSPESATPVPPGIIGYVFNAKTQDVTLFDPATRQVLATKPLGVVVRWLSNEQRYWDGQHIWTYDFPEDRVQAVAIDPGAVAVKRILPTGGTGPAHSLMLTPGHKTAWVNVAGGNYLAVLDIATGEVVDEVKTGAFP